VRQPLVWDRTRLLTQLRGLLSEFGIVMAKGRYPAQSAIPGILEDADKGLPKLARRVIQQLWGRIEQTNADITGFDRELYQLATASEEARRLMTIPGVAEQTATGVLASVPDSHQFNSGRQFAAWLDMVPRQYTTGGKTRLRRVSKKGDQYLRPCLVHGARSVVASLRNKHEHASCWLRNLIERRGYLRAVVALAARNARLIWTLLVKQDTYRVMSADA